MTGALPLARLARTMGTGTVRAQEILLESQAGGWCTEVAPGLWRATPRAVHELAPAFAAISADGTLGSLA